MGRSLIKYVIQKIAHGTLVEEYKRGYPRLAAFVASDPSFAIARRFSYLHARNVLYRQDRLADLEAQLQELDENEQTQWYLSSRRDDGNSLRAQLLSRLGDELREYENALFSHLRVHTLPSPSSRAKENVQTWMNQYKPLVKSEADFILKSDLLTLDSTEDRGRFDEIIERAVERVLPRNLGYRLLSSKETRVMTSDQNVHIYKPGRLRMLSRVVVTLVVVALLLVPILVLYNVHTSLRRFLTIIFSILGFAFIVCLTTKARKVEIFTATAAYGAVLVVFVAQSA
ncbi:hypothetical protein P154DRAFT_571370 [Amniculicola lignicola CBS 123094]|uniref:DUF6594 domain-containing protein n=1 Tax=Amniculicola lignicola CBS 123094 TaxID=1392246 RepID=A0A6A5X2A5_9PLEO|nr:hypothetical protein P154DRAFT_571370 [Amniculicola lignicola CBS 123094]